MRRASLGLATAACLAIVAGCDSNPGGPTAAPVSAPAGGEGGAAASGPAVKNARPGTKAAGGAPTVSTKD